MLGKKNVILCVGKQGTAIGNNEWSLVWISSLPTDKNVNPRGGAYLFPLFIFEEGYANPTFNFAYDIIEKFEEKIGLKMSGIFHSFFLQIWRNNIMFYKLNEQANV